MKIFEISKDGSLRLGAHVTADGTLNLGESGRGRKLTTVALGGAVIEDDGAGRHFATSFKPSTPGVPGEVLLVIRDRSGFRGGWRIRAAPSAEADAEFEAAKKSAAPRTVGSCLDCSGQFVCGFPTDGGLLCERHGGRGPNGGAR